MTSPPNESYLPSSHEKWALVTGASRGIGAAIAECFARDGFHIILNYLKNTHQAEAVADRIRQYGGRVMLSQFDVSDAEGTMLSLTAIQKNVHIDVLVNNAGVTRDGPFPTMNGEAWSQVLDVALNGFYNVTRPLVMPMVRKKWGRIITLSSVSGIRGNRGQVNYSAAKAGLIGATKALALELAKRNITVNAVAPGLIDTEMIQGAPVDEILKFIPMRRLGKAAEVAELVSFLASDRAAYITGQVFSISGGLD